MQRINQPFVYFVTPFLKFSWGIYFSGDVHNKR